MKYIVFFLLLSFNLSASTISAEEKIYASVLHALFPAKENIVVWSDDPKKEQIFSSISHVIVTDTKERADILFLFHTFHIKSKKPKFVGSYVLLKHYKDDAIGGFYWQKGRPNLLFLRKNLLKQGLRVENSLQKYVEDSF